MYGLKMCDWCFTWTLCNYRHHQHGRWQARIGRVAGNKDLYLGTFSKYQRCFFSLYVEYSRIYIHHTQANYCQLTISTQWELKQVLQLIVHICRPAAYGCYIWWLLKMWPLHQVKQSCIAVVHYLVHAPQVPFSNLIPCLVLLLPPIHPCIRSK